MLISTFKEYQKKYQSRLSDYLNDYEDHTPQSFLEMESEIYTKYYNSLISIKTHFKELTTKEIEKLDIYSGIAKELKDIDENIYFDIVTELKKDGDEVDFDNLSIKELMKDLILINFTKLDYHIISSKRILDFISDQQTISQSKNKGATSLYLTGEIPSEIIKTPSENMDGTELNLVTKLNEQVIKPKINKFDEIDYYEVIEHFKKLHESKYISKDDFNLFIKTVFEENKTLSKKINLIKENSNTNFKKIFYKYYKLQSKIYGNRKKYVKLLSDNFTGFDYDSIFTNFSK